MKVYGKGGTKQVEVTQRVTELSEYTDQHHSNYPMLCTPLSSEFKILSSDIVIKSGHAVIKSNFSYVDNVEF